MTPERAGDIAVRLCRDPERLGEAFEAMLAFDDARYEPTEAACRAWIGLCRRRRAIDAARRAIFRGRGRTRTLGDWTIPVRDPGPDLVDARDELRAFLAAAMPVTQRLLRAYAHSATKREAARRCGRRGKGATHAIGASIAHERTVRADAHRRRFGEGARAA